MSANPLGSHSTECAREGEMWTYKRRHQAPSHSLPNGFFRFLFPPFLPTDVHLMGVWLFGMSHNVHLPCSFGNSPFSFQPPNLPPLVACPITWEGYDAKYAVPPGALNALLIHKSTMYLLGEGALYEGAKTGLSKGMKDDGITSLMRTRVIQRSHETHHIERPWEEGPTSSCSLSQIILTPMHSLGGTAYRPNIHIQ